MEMTRKRRRSDQDESGYVDELQIGSSDTNMLSNDTNMAVNDDGERGVLVAPDDIDMEEDLNVDADPQLGHSEAATVVEVNQNAASQPIEAAMEQYKRRHVNVVFIGDLDAGKSTIAAMLIHSGTPPTLDKTNTNKDYKYLSDFLKEKKKEPCAAYFMDTDEEERMMDMTIEVGRATYLTQNSNYTILDAPGHNKFVSNMISGASQADIGVLVISAREGEFERGFKIGGQTREHVHLAQASCVKKLLVVINKMDTVKWSKERYYKIESEMVQFLGGAGYHREDDLKFLPVSGLESINIIKIDTDVCPWWNGQCLVEALEAVVLPQTDPNGPFRMSIAHRIPNYERPNDSFLMGRVESGSVREGESLIIMPVNVQVQVRKMFCNEEELTNLHPGVHNKLSVYRREDGVRSASPGDNIRVQLAGVDMPEGYIRPGFVLCDIGNRIPAVYEFVAELRVFGLPDNTFLCAGYKSVLHTHSVVEDCEIIEINPNYPMDQRRWGTRKRLPAFVKNGEKIVCRLQVSSMICVESFYRFQKLGWCALRTDGNTIAIGFIAIAGAYQFRNEN